MRTTTGIAGAFMLLFGAGCAGTPSDGEGRTAEASSYLVIDRAAREAGVRLEGVSARDAILPVELTVASSPKLEGPDGPIAIDPRAGEVVVVRGAEARIDRGALGQDVARDRVAVLGSAAAADALAAEIGGVVDARDGRFVVVGPEALAGLARASMPEGLDEIVPVLPDDAAGRPAFSGALGASLSAADRGLVRAAAPVAPGRRAFEVDDFLRDRLALPPDALLPAAVDCPDPVVGTWVSREHYPTYGDWYRFELHVRRDARDPKTLVGAISARSWTGGVGEGLPQRCSTDPEDAGMQFDWTVRMAATGSLDGDAVRFGGRSLSVERTRCGAAYDGRHYMLDQFEGRLVEGGRYLRAVNNDGGRSFDDPHLFRRVSCQP
jgi:hypothetical protein